MNALQQTLHDMGSTPQEVADTLKQAGIKGRQRSCEDCPLALYLRQKGFADAVVGIESGIDVPDRASWAYHDEPHTKATELFVLWFDSGNFPELESPRY